MKNKVVLIISNIVFVLLLVSAVLLLVRNTCYTAIVISGNSMSPTLRSGEYGYANKTKSAINNIERFDIIMFEDIKNEEKRGLIKRVIGLPGETIEFKGDDCTLYVNNVEVTQDFITHEVQKQTGRNLNYGYSLNTPITLGDDSYFVLGDNRANSFDSLHGLGLVKKDQIEGVLTIVFGSCDSIEDEDGSIVCEGKHIENIRFF